MSGRIDSAPSSIRRFPMVVPLLWSALLSVLMLGGALGPGHVLSYDMVWVPDLRLGADALGLGAAPPRAVPSDAMVATLDEARRSGFTETILRRRRYLPDLTSDNRQRREKAERMALNAPIQGSAADLVKVAMLGVERALAEQGLRSRMLLQVHDELVREVAPGGGGGACRDRARGDGRRRRTRRPPRVFNQHRAQLARRPHWAGHQQPTDAASDHDAVDHRRPVRHLRSWPDDRAGD